MIHEERGIVDLAEETLDPNDWQALKGLGHRMMDEMFDWLETVRERPVHVPIPEEVADRFQAPVPHEPQDPARVFEEFRENILPYPHGNIHPRFWGWVTGTGTPTGMLADMLAAAMNSNSGFGDHCVVHLERQVLAWMKEALGFPSSASGILVSGCSVANLTALTIARNTRAGWDVRNEGMHSTAPPLAAYGSVETHSSNHRALELLGLGRESFRPIEVDADHRIRVDRLRQRIADDLAAGVRPICVIANAGTVNIGAFDDLEALADVCAEFGIWLHVDGAFGALAALAPSLRRQVAGLERADSVAFDLHKWMHVPYDVGAVLVRDATAHGESFQMSGAYLDRFESRLATGPINFMSHGVQMSRGFRALKVWMTIKEHGIDKIGRLVAQNVDQAQYLAGLVDAAPDLERAAPVPLNIVCLRYVPADGQYAEDEIDSLNRTLLAELHDSGVAAPSHTLLDGRFVIRVAITNHRSRREDFDLLVDELRTRGRSSTRG